MRWLDLLQGIRTGDCTPVEQQQRVTEAKKILEHVFGKPYDECLRILTKDTHTRKLLSAIPTLQEACHQAMQPSLESLLSFKDQLRIPDASWPYVADTFHLGQECSIHYIRKLRGAKNTASGVQPTAGGRGYEYNIEEILSHLIRKHPPKDPTKVSNII